MGNKLFPKFGEFDSYEEINRAAEAQLKEGDKEAIKLLAKENGLDEMDAEDYMSAEEKAWCNRHHLSDLHGNNYGFRKGHVCIVDYACRDCYGSD